MCHQGIGQGPAMMLVSRLLAMLKLNISLSLNSSSCVFNLLISPHRRVAPVMVSVKLTRRTVVACSPMTVAHVSQSVMTCDGAWHNCRVAWCSKAGAPRRCLTYPRPTPRFFDVLSRVVPSVYDNWKPKRLNWNIFHWNDALSFS